MHCLRPARTGRTAGLPLPFLLALAAGCGGPSLDELNADHAVADPTADSTAPSAPYQPGQRRSVGGAGSTFVQPAVPGFLVGAVMPGDLDGDGFADLVIWGWLGNPPDTVPCHNGCPAFDQLDARIFYGSPTIGKKGSALVESARLESWHMNGGRYLVAPAGDTNGDGRADLLLSVGQYGCRQNNVFLLLGGPRLSGTHDVRDVGWLLRESGSCTGFGAAAGVGDLDGDTLSDFAITAPDAAGGPTYLYYGSADTPPARRSELDADATLLAPGGVHLGAALAAGDVDGDGHGDMIVLGDARMGDRPAWLLRGGSRLRGTHALDEPGPGVTRFEVAGLHRVGDLDGDGRDELLATVASGSRDGFLIAGRAEWPAAVEVRALPAFVRLASPIPGNETASAMAAGDVDGDGRRDFVYGEPGYQFDGAPTGAAHLFRGPVAPKGPALDIATATTFLGQSYQSDLDPNRRTGFDHLGAAMAGGTDLDGDHLDDLAFIGNATTQGSGRAFLWMGRRAR